MNQFKIRIKQLRQKNHISQTVLAQHLGYGPTAIANYESGRNEPNITDLIKIANYFNVTLDYLCGKSDVEEFIYCGNPPEKEKIYEMISGISDPVFIKELNIYLQYLLFQQNNEKKK